jgi:hypothetical protein
MLSNQIGILITIRSIGKTLPHHHCLAIGEVVAIVLDTAGLGILAGGTEKF